MSSESSIPASLADRKDSSGRREEFGVFHSQIHVVLKSLRVIECLYWGHHFTKVVITILDIANGSKSVSANYFDLYSDLSYGLLNLENLKNDSGFVIDPLELTVPILKTSSYYSVDPELEPLPWMPHFRLALVAHSVSHSLFLARFRQSRWTDSHWSLVYWYWWWNLNT